MKSKIHLNACLGLILIGVGGLTAFIAGVEIYYSYHDRLIFGPENQPIWEWEQMYFLMLGFAHLLVGGGLIAKARWSYWATSTVCVFAFLGWTYIVAEVFEFENASLVDFWIEVGLTVLVYSLLIVGGLFLGNEKVRKELTESSDDFWENEILDL